MSSVLFWLLQDLLTVLVWGVMQVPEIRWLDRKSVV